MVSLDISTRDTTVATVENPSQISPPETTAKPLVICPHAIATFAWDIEEQRQHLFALGCRKWSCDVCGPRKRSILIRRIVKASPTKFITLSCRHEHGPEHQLKTITKALPKLITQIRKSIGDIEYLRALEYCKDGYPHYHLLARVKYIDQADLSTMWTNLTSAPVVDIRKAHGRSTSYVSKYMSKATGTENSWVRQQFSVSRNFWQDDERETQWLNWETKRIPVYEKAQSICEVNSLDRVAVGCYKIVDKIEGDDVPLELCPQWWFDQSHPIPIDEDEKTPFDIDN
jgi:hypothetical protein